MYLRTILNFSMATRILPGGEITCEHEEQLRWFYYI
jgi:hypothetical protein